LPVANDLQLARQVREVIKDWRGLEQQFQEQVLAVVPVTLCLVITLGQFASCVCSCMLLPVSVVLCKICQNLHRRALPAGETRTQEHSDILRAHSRCAWQAYSRTVVSNVWTCAVRGWTSCCHHACESRLSVLLHRSMLQRVALCCDVTQFKFVAVFCSVLQWVGWLYVAIKPQRVMMMMLLLSLLGK